MMRRLSLLLCALLLALGSLVHAKPAHAIGGSSQNVAPFSFSFCASGVCYLRVYKFDDSRRGYIWRLDWDNQAGWHPWLLEVLPFSNAGNVAENYYRWAVDNVANAQCQIPNSNWQSATSTSLYDVDAKRATPGTDTRGGSFVTALILATPNYGNTELFVGPTTYGCGLSIPSFTNIGGLTNWSPTVEYLTDGIHVFATGVDATVFQWTSYAGWTNFLGGGSAGSPSVVSWDHDQRTDIFVRGLDNAMYHRWYDPSIGWYPTWENLGGLLDSGPGCTSRMQLHLDCFVVGSGGHLYQKWWEPASGWQGWYDLG